LRRFALAAGATTLWVVAPVLLPAPASAVPAPRAAACPPGLGIGLAEIPTARAKDPRAQSYIVDFVHPGTTFSRKIQVCNGTSAPQHVDLYADAASIEGGGFVLAAGHGENELSRWITVSPTSLELPSQKRVVIEATIAVPLDAPAGEGYAAVVAELPASPGTANVKLVSRVGVRVYLDVGTGGEPRSDFTIDTLTATRDSAGAPVVKASVHNIGHRAIDLRGQLKLSDGPGGLSAGPFPAKLGTTLAPGQTEPLTVPLDKALPAGPWHARIDVFSGLLHHAAEGTITFPLGAGTSSPPVKAKNISLAKNRNFLVPLAILLLLGIAIGIFFLFWKRRKRKDEDEEQRPAR
jgi:hypothetical protein